MSGLTGMVRYFDADLGEVAVHVTQSFGEILLDHHHRIERSRPVSDNEDPHIQPFAAFLQTLRRGEVHDELSEALHALVDRITEVGKKGSVTLRIEIKRDAKTGMMLVADDVKIVLPEHDREASMWFVDKRGNLSRTDPRQLKFETMTGLDGGKTTDKIQSIQGEQTS